MRVLSSLLLIFFVLFPINLSLSASDDWPKKFKQFDCFNRDKPLFKAFNDDYYKKRFNEGYSPSTDPRKELKNTNDIPRKYKQYLYSKLMITANEEFALASERLENCPDLNRLFGHEPKLNKFNLKKNLEKMPRNLLFKDIGSADGTITDDEIIIDDKSLGAFFYSMGKKCRELDQGIVSRVDVTPEDFLKDWGSKKTTPLLEIMGHEMLHFLTGFNGGGLTSECVAHCLTKNCIDPNYDMKAHTYTVRKPGLH